MSFEDSNRSVQEHTPLIKFIEVSTLLVIFLLALIGNIITIAAILGVKSLRKNLHTAFVVNLCVMDLMVCFFSMTFSMVDVFIGGYLEGSVGICRFNCFMAMFALYGNFSGVTLIAVNRCIGIVYSHVIQLKRRHALIMIAFSWVYSFSIAFPTTYDGFSANATYHSGTHHCSPDWKGSSVYKIVCLVLLYGVTAPIMIVSYTLIIREIRKREAQVKKYSGCGSEERVKTIELNSRNGELSTKNTNLVSFSLYPLDSTYHVNLGEQNENNVTVSTISTGNLEKETVHSRIVMTRRGNVFKDPDIHGKLPSHGKVSNRSTASRIGADKRVAFAGGLLVLTSTLCWAPYYIVHAFVGSPIHGLGVFSMWLGYSNSALDPIIYSLLSQRIRNAVKEMWGKFLRKGRCRRE